MLFQGAPGNRARHVMATDVFDGVVDVKHSTAPWRTSGEIVRNSPSLATPASIEANVAAIEPDMKRSCPLRLYRSTTNAGEAYDTKPVGLLPGSDGWACSSAASDMMRSPEASSKLISPARRLARVTGMRS
jgi:hypothetical protein